MWLSLSLCFAEVTVDAPLELNLEPSVSTLSPFCDLLVRAVSPIVIDSNVRFWLFLALISLNFYPLSLLEKLADFMGDSAGSTLLRFGVSLDLLACNLYTLELTFLYGVLFESCPDGLFGAGDGLFLPVFFFTSSDALSLVSFE